MNINHLIQLITAVPASVAFAVIFNVHGKKLGAIALGSGIGWIAYILLGLAGVDEYLSYFLVATLISLFAEAMARILKAPATIFIVPSLIPLIPGAALYYTMAHAFGGASDKFAEQAGHTLTLGAALAIGIIVSAVFMQVITREIQASRERRAHNKRDGAKK